MLECPCCFEKVASFHKNSHIIPDWACAEYYDELHRVKNVSVDDRTDRLAQTAFQATIWCQSCEVESGEYDRYASLILRKENQRQRDHLGVKVQARQADAALPGPINVLAWTGIDFVKFQRFVFGMIIRWDLMSRPKGVLGEKHFEQIRRIYKGELTALDESSYPLLVETLAGAPKGFEAGCLALTKSEDHNGVHVRASGYDFYVYVSSHAKPNYVKNLRLRSSGDIFMPIRDFSKSPATSATFGAVVENSKRRIGLRSKNRIR